jgi:hypothetical protein
MTASRIQNRSSFSDCGACGNVGFALIDGADGLLDGAPCPMCEAGELTARNWERRPRWFGPLPPPVTVEAIHWVERSAA